MGAKRNWQLTKESEKRLEERLFLNNKIIDKINIDEFSREMMVEYTNTGTIIKDQIEKANLNWRSISKILIKNKWAKKINSKKICLSESLNLDDFKIQDNMRKVFDKDDFRKLSPILDCSLKIFENFDLIYINKKDAEIERDLLLREYEIGHETGKHWDLLRWKISMYFHGVEVFFIGGAMTGLLMLAEIIGNIDQICIKTVLFFVLIILACINISLCNVWKERNTGIHAWHKASATRSRLIEIDPRLRHTIKRDTLLVKEVHGNTKISQSMKEHSTGYLESERPPKIFKGIWWSIIILTIVVFIHKNGNDACKYSIQVWQALKDQYLLIITYFLNL